MTSQNETLWTTLCIYQLIPPIFVTEMIFPRDLHATFPLPFSYFPLSFPNIFLIFLILYPCFKLPSLHRSSPRLAIIPVF